jgi:drug/metabolite transporter (DMT)-like permease
MKAIIWLGGLLALLGVVGLAFPRFTTSQTTDLASVGNIKYQNKTISHHLVSQPLTIAALLLGFALIGAGAYARQKGMSDFAVTSALATDLKL